MIKESEIIELNGVKYWQPKCHCKGSGHICYLRPVPVVANNIDIEKLMKNGAISGN